MLNVTNTKISLKNCLKYCQISWCNTIGPKSEYPSIKSKNKKQACRNLEKINKNCESCILKKDWDRLLNIKEGFFKNLFSAKWLAEQKSFLNNKNDIVTMHSKRAAKQPYNFSIKANLVIFQPVILLKAFFQVTSKNTFPRTQKWTIYIKFVWRVLQLKKSIYFIFFILKF